jgi:hypothetical protein
MNSGILLELINNDSKEFLDAYLGNGNLSKDLLEAIIYCHNNNLFGKSLFNKQYTIDQLIHGLNVIQALIISYDLLSNIIMLIDLHLKKLEMDQNDKTVQDDLLTIRVTIEETFRSFFNCVGRFTKI